ncbi:MAG: hypothetical protein MPW16_06330 [Candidatus Manganitrophus sp.]|nr:MAG: hypothetical protein MPW16_06330 [Candidatus Manganitrophus sp.]
MRRIAGLIISALLLVGSGCTPEVPQPSQKNGSPNIRASGAAAMLSKSEYDALSSEQKYAVADKLMGTLYKGVPVSDFFNIEAGLANPTLKRETNFLEETEAALSHPLEDKAVYLARIEEKYSFDEERQPIEYPLAMLFEFPVSRDYFHRWIAYRLANSILFSPALENDSVDYTDIQDIQFRLVKMMDEGKTIREIVYEHMISQENWRRFRSPEDNTREMIEIFLGLFDQDAEVPKASIACKNWSLTDDEQGYQLVIGFDENTEPQEVLGAAILSCYDFYQAVAQHPLLIPRVASVLVDAFFVGYPPENKAALVNAIAAAGPTTFDQLFFIILFSKEYLLNAERPKEFEETFFNTAGKIQWVAYERFFVDLNSPFGGTTFPTLRNMGQASLTYKLGRFPDVPLDSLSFSYYHKAVRERLLIDRKTDAFNPADGGWQKEFTNVALQGDDFIHYLFLSVISRKATADELLVLNDAIVKRRYQTNKEGQAMIVFDYLSRLAELYTFVAVR